MRITMLCAKAQDWLTQAKGDVKQRVLLDDGERKVIGLGLVAAEQRVKAAEAEIKAAKENLQLWQWLEKFNLAEDADHIRADREIGLGSRIIERIATGTKGFALEDVALVEKQEALALAR